MVRKLLVGMALFVVILIAVWYINRTPTRELVLAQAGPVDPDAPEEFTTTESGLRYRILRRGDGRKPDVKDTITANYAGWLDNGTQFDSSYGKRPLKFPLGQVVPGWIEGLQLLKEGGMIELEIPSKLGYGSRGAGRMIPPNSRLHFIVELLAVEPGPEPAEAGPRDPDAPEEFTTTDSGLKYRILRKGDGEQPGPVDTVTVHYKGWLDNGTVFDSSYDRGQPTPMRLDGVIPGWTEGLQLVHEGGMIELEIPSDLGYGPSGFPPTIPPNATLHFLIELIKVH